MRIGWLFSFALAACSASTPPAHVGTILFLGNSLTVHPADTSIGWVGAWGMAASDSTRDYAHLVASRFPGAMHVQLSMKAFEDGYRTYPLRSLDAWLATAPDLIVVEVGDNVVDASAFAPYYAALIGYLTTYTRATIVCVSTWWPADAINIAIRASCPGGRTRYADINRLWADPANRASAERSFSDPAVGEHPGDRGMSRIASIIAASVR